MCCDKGLLLLLGECSPALAYCSVPLHSAFVSARNEKYLLKKKKKRAVPQCKHDGTHSLHKTTIRFLYFICKINTRNKTSCACFTKNQNQVATGLLFVTLNSALEVGKQISDALQDAPKSGCDADMLPPSVGKQKSGGTQGWKCLP